MAICVRKCFNEMDNFLGYKDYSSKTIAKRLRVHKPYWNDNLTILWKALSIKEREYLRYRGNRRDTLKTGIFF